MPNLDQSRKPLTTADVLHTEGERIFKNFDAKSAVVRARHGVDFSRIPSSSGLGPQAAAATDATRVATPTPLKASLITAPHRDSTRRSAPIATRPAARDATAVSTHPVSNLNRLRAMTEARAKEEFLAKSQQSLATISSADPNSIRRDARAAGYQALLDLFGGNETLATIFWTLRGAPADSDEVTFWSLLNSLDGVGTSPSIEQTPQVPKIESTR